MTRAIEWRTGSLSFQFHHPTVSLTRYVSNRSDKHLLGFVQSNVQQLITQIDLVGFRYLRPPFRDSFTQLNSSQLSNLIMRRSRNNFYKGRDTISSSIVLCVQDRSSLTKEEEGEKKRSMPCCYCGFFLSGRLITFLIVSESWACANFVKRSSRPARYCYTKIFESRVFWCTAFKCRYLHVCVVFFVVKTWTEEEYKIFFFFRFSF